MKHTATFSVLFFVSFLFGCNGSQESFPLDDQCLPIIDKFFEGIRAKSYDQALVKLLGSNENINLNDSTTIDLRRKFVTINEWSGNYVGFKIIKKRNIDDDVAVYSCLVKYQKKFYRYVFMFYKAEKSGNIYKFKFDDSIDIELEESLKLYM